MDLENSTAHEDEEMEEHSSDDELDIPRVDNKVEMFALTCLPSDNQAPLLV